MHTAARPPRSLALNLLLVTAAACAAACDPDPPLCAESKAALTLPQMEKGWCTAAGQRVGLDGYCECVEPQLKFDTQANACVACTPTPKGDKTCGSDGCDGSFGVCAAGLLCDQGQCKACQGSCDGRNCGDDGCGRTCGTCGSGQVCDNGQCVAKDTSQVVTDCSCQDIPPGAAPGLTRPELTCPTGLAQFQFCDQKQCGTAGVRAWREICFTVPTGMLAAPCNCYPPPDGPQSFWRDGRRVDANVCTEKAARIWACGTCTCMDAYGNPIPCAWPAWQATCDKC